MKSDSSRVVHFSVIDRAVGRRSVQLARGNLCVTDIPRAAKPSATLQELNGNLLMQQPEGKKGQSDPESQKAAASACLMQLYCPSHCLF